MKAEIRLVLFSLVVVFCWGIVPTFAKAANQSWEVTTFFVNWTAVVALGLFVVLSGRVMKLDRLLPYTKVVGIGMVWPLLYSFLYFGSVQVGTASLTTITNYTWPVFCLLWGVVYGKKFMKQSWLLLIFAFLAVTVPILADGLVQVGLLAVFLGLMAAVCQGWYTQVTDGFTLDPWLVTLVVSVVTAIGSTVFVIARGSVAWVGWESFFYLGAIGLLGNAIGFGFFLLASQLGGKLGEQKVIFLGLMSLVPFAQVVICQVMGQEMVTPARWVGVALLVVMMFWYRLSSRLV